VNQQKKNPSNGYLIVASKTKAFYYSALNLIESIKDYHPEADCCLVVDKYLVDDRAESVPDRTIYTELENDYRAKLWGMWKTPYTKTLYLDADMECQHEDVAKVFDELGDNDMVFTALDESNEEAFKNRHFPAGMFELNGGVCLYDSSKPEVLSFMERWWRLYTLQKRDEWWPEDPVTGEWDEYSYGDRNDMKWWDQFTLWYLLNKEERWKDLKVELFEDYIRWNNYVNFEVYKIKPKNPIVFMHHSASLAKDNHHIYSEGLFEMRGKGD
jgi:hypothetical protein